MRVDDHVLKEPYLVMVPRGHELASPMRLPLKRVSASFRWQLMDSHHQRW